MAPHLTDVYGRIWASPDLPADLDDLCRLGGRFAGTRSELLARDLVAERLAAATGAPTRRHSFPFEGWIRGECRLELLGSRASDLAATSLVLSPSTPPEGLELELFDVGRGTAQDFAAVRDELAGRAVLVRHEFAFTTAHTHRRRKYGSAREAGAAAFLIANNLPGVGVVTGSSGSGDATDIPAAGLSYEAGEILARAGDGARLRLRLDARREPWTPANLLAEIPGRTDEWVVLCAHLDGHDLAESAMDNATGVVAALEVARQLRDAIPGFRRGLRVMFFTVEEWALLGSRIYVESLSEAERRKIALAINLDTLTGSPHLAALTQGWRDVEAFVADATAGAGAPIRMIRPILGNSDHYNFFRAGIPTFRLIAGYEDPTSLTRFLLTPADTRDKVDIGQLRIATMTTAALVTAACDAAERPARHRTPEEVEAALAR